MNEAEREILALKVEKSLDDRVIYYPGDAVIPSAEAKFATYILTISPKYEMSRQAKAKVHDQKKRIA